MLLSPALRTFYKVLTSTAGPVYGKLSASIRGRKKSAKWVSSTATVTFFIFLQMTSGEWCKSMQTVTNFALCSASMSLVCLGHSLECYECGEVSDLGNCDKFTASKDYAIECGQRYKSCVSATGEYAGITGDPSSLLSASIQQLLK